MKVQELLMNIHNKEFNLERGLQIKKYLPMEVKKTIAQGILYESTNDDTGVVKVDSVQRYLSYVKYMITTHTNLEYTDNDYDALCSTMYGDITLLNAIMNCFEADAKECSRILNLMSDDLVYANSIECTLGEVLYNMNNLINAFMGKIEKRIEELNLNEVDMDKLNSFLNPSK